MLSMYGLVMKKSTSVVSGTGAYKFFAAAGNLEAMERQKEKSK